MKLAYAVALLAVLFPTTVKADPPSWLVDANAAIVKNVFQPIGHEFCVAMTWKYALKSYSGTNATNDPSMCNQ